MALWCLFLSLCAGIGSFVGGWWPAWLPGWGGL
jgi:hypothetical protein